MAGLQVKRALASGNLSPTGPGLKSTFFFPPNEIKEDTGTNLRRKDLG